MTGATAGDKRATVGSNSALGSQLDAADRRVKLLLVGVGGQGVLTAAKILGAAAHDGRLPVVVGQLHGMTQRGGSVDCSVLFGHGESSFITGGHADVVVAFEPLEALRALPMIGPNTRVIVNLGAIVPFEVTRARREYPPVSELVEQVRSASPHLLTVDGPKLLEEVGVGRTLNVMMLGVVAGLNYLPFDEDLLWSAVARRSPDRYRDANRKAFQVGFGWGRNR